MTPQHATVRPRADVDLPALAAALVRVHAVDGYPVEGVADPEAWLKHPHELGSWTAELDGQPIGQVTLTTATPGDDAAQLWTQQTSGSADDLAIVVRLFVDPGHRGVGAARLLMIAALNHARSLGRTVVLDVMAKDQAAIRLYERLGGQRLGEITHHHSGDQAEPAIAYAFPRIDGTRP